MAGLGCPVDLGVGAVAGLLKKTQCDVETKERTGCGRDARGRLRSCGLVKRKRAKHDALWRGFGLRKPGNPLPDYVGSETTMDPPLPAGEYEFASRMNAVDTGWCVSNSDCAIRPWRGLLGRVRGTLRRKHSRPGWLAG